jgi:hypothetical protein
MTPITRRQALKLATAAGTVTALGATGTAANAQAQKGKANQEPPVHSSATADNHGPRELFAVVDTDGSLKRGLHAVGAKRLDIGTYEVIFNRDIRRGCYLATIGGASYGGLPPVGQIGVMGRANNPKAVLVTTTNSSGDPIDTGFHLLVISPEGYA